MPPFFTFMTGATKYRIEARSRDEAIHYVFEALQATEEMKAVILATLCDESEAGKFVDDESTENKTPKA
jgi:hypothetical protein